MLWGSSIGGSHASPVRQSDAAAAALIRQLAIEVDDLWDRLSRVYAFLRGESSEDPIQQEIQELRELLQQPREVQ